MNEIKRIIFEEQLDKHKSEALRKKFGIYQIIWNHFCYYSMMMICVLEWNM